jgi:hypothetical protein
LHVTSQALTSLLPLVTGDQAKAEGVTYFAANPLSDPEPLPPSPPPPARAPAPAPTEPARRFVGGKRDKGIRGDALVLETLRSGAADMSELKHTFEHRKFAAASVPQYVSKLLKSKQIERRPNGRFALAANGRGATP